MCARLRGSLLDRLRDLEELLLLPLILLQDLVEIDILGVVAVYLCRLRLGLFLGLGCLLLLLLGLQLGVRRIRSGSFL